MAIAHLEVKVFTRSHGDSVVAKAAYRAGEILHDERIGLTWNYSGKRHVDARFILAPEGAPAWALQRETLWNEVERHETRDDSQLARELEISLPRELTHEQQDELLRSFIHENFVARGMVADCAIHRPPAKPGASTFESEHIGEHHGHNPHAHVLLTMRDLHQSGFGIKNRSWNDWNLREHTRALWEGAANRALEAAGRYERIDMRSFADRDIDLEPQPKRYRSAAEAHLDGRDRVLEQNVEVQRTARRNGERIIERPEVVLELLEAKQSVFTEHQLLRTLNRYTADAEQFERARCALFASPELVELYSDSGPRRFSTRTTVAAEQSLLAHGEALAARAHHQVSLTTINRAIASSQRPLTDEQSAAVRHLAASGDLAILQGYAGSGKSTMLDAVRRAWQAEGYTVVGGALAGKAAEGLSDPDSPAIPSRTLAAWRWAWEHGRDRLTNKHVLVIDEAGMVGTSELESILATARDAGAKVVLVGDTRQLQAIAPGAPMRMLQEQHGAVKLTRVIRQRTDWQTQATMLFGDGNAEQALRLYVEQSRTHQVSTVEDAQRSLVAQWATDRRAHPEQTDIILAYRRKDVQALNELARSVRRAAGELGTDHLLSTNNGERAFAVSDRIYFLKNSNQLGVKNGTLATIEAIAGSRVTARLDNGRQVTFSADDYKDLDYGYAATVHKAQGVTKDRAYVLASRYMDSAATYVAMSRHRNDVQLYYAQDEFRDHEVLVKSLTRVRASSMALDGEAKLPSPEKLDRALKEELAFLELPPDAQAAQVAKWERDGNRATRSAADVLEVLPEVRTAVAAREGASNRLAGAQRAFQDFCEQHPIARELRSHAYRAAEAALEAAQQNMLVAEQALTAVRKNPQLRARADHLASRHNIAIADSRRRWTWAQGLLARQARDAALWGFADAANRARGDRAFRVAKLSDEGKSFEVVLKREVNGQPVFILRSPYDASLIVADASLFRHAPTVGTHAVLVGHERSTAQPKRAASDVTKDRDRGRGR